MAGRTLAVFLACLAGSLSLLLAPPRHPPALGDVKLLFLGALALEVAAPKLRAFGFFSGAPALWLGLGILSPASASVLGLSSLLALGLRQLTKGHSRHGLAELVADWAPLTAALLALRWAPHGPVASPLVLVAVWATAPGLVADGLEEETMAEWGRFRSALFPLQLAVAGASWLVADSSTLVHQAVACVVLGGAASSASAVARAVEAQVRQVEQWERQRQLDQKEVGLTRFEESLAQAGQAHQRSEADLAVRLETYTLVDKMLEAVTGRPALADVAQAVVDRVRRRVPCQSVVLFWNGAHGTVSLAASTPYKDRLQASMLLRAREPVVERCLAHRQIERMLPDDAEVERIFPEEKSTLAVPVQARGALYLGHPTPLEVTEDQRHFLQVLANHAVLALEAAELYEAQQTSLQREATAASRNEALVQRLAQVIDGVTELVKVQEPQAMLDRTGAILEPIVPHDLRYLCGSGDPSGRTQRLAASAGTGAELMAPLAQTVIQNAKPLLIDYLNKSRFLPPVPEATSALAVPIVTDRGCLGAIVVVRCGSAAFQREDQDVLAVLAYQLGAALLAAELYSRLQVAHQQLKESQAQLVQSSKLAAIGQLAGGVAHELNTPLGAIALAVDGALMTLHNKPERAESRLQRAQGSVAQMKQIVSKLLFYSRDARSGRRETDVNQVVQDALQLIGHQLTMENVQLLTDLQPVPTFQANQNELQQVVTNLCLNARDAVLANAGERKILVSSRLEGEEVTLSVRDNGCGMPADVRERIFEPFYTTKEVGKGTGLGLSVTLQLIQQHGGRIAVESAPGQGTVFRVTLPLEGPPEEEA